MTTTTTTTTTTPEPAPSRSARAVPRTIAGPVVAVLAALALILGFSAPASAATGPQTGDWDIIGADFAQSPDIQSYDHAASWEHVPAPSGWFAVGSGRVIEGEGSTDVTGGGVRVVNDTENTGDVTISFVYISGGDIVITDEDSNVVFDSSVSSSWVIDDVPPGEFHEHYDWEFVGEDEEVTITVAIFGAGFTGQSQSYLFKF